MQSTILVILPTWAVFSLSLSLPPQISSIISTNGKQDAARRLEATWGKHGFLCYIFRLWVILKALLKQFPYHIWIIVLTCADNKSARNHQPKYSCVPAKSHKSQWCEANTISIEIFSLSVCSCSCEDSRVPPLNLYKDISIVALQRISTV